MSHDTTKTPATEPRHDLLRSCGLEHDLTTDERSSLARTVQWGAYDTGDDGEPYARLRDVWLTPEQAHRLLGIGYPK